MKIIHTADWHIGQTFFDYDRKAEHIKFLEWLKGKIKELNTDVLLVAGDVFDAPNPSAESQRIYYHFLRDITAESPDLQIIIIAGNHDSAARLEAPGPLLESMNISVRGIVKRTDDNSIDLNYLIIPLKKGGYCLAVPYLRHGDYPHAETYRQGVQNLYETLFASVKDCRKPVIAVGHLYAAGSRVSENDPSERTVTGGLESISPDAFAHEITYTALGHLHQSQQVSGRKNVMYSGSPLPVSFAEKNSKKYIVSVEITDETKIKRIEFDVPVKLLSVPSKPAPLNMVLDQIAGLPEGEISETSPYLEVKVLITEPEPSLRYNVENALKTKSVRLAHISTVMPDNETAVSPVITCEQLQTINPMDIATDIFRRRYNGEDMPEKMKVLLQGIIHEVQL